MTVIALGNPFDGMTIYGPFYDAELAVEYAEGNFQSDDWWIMDVEPVEVDSHEDCIVCEARSRND